MRLAKYLAQCSIGSRREACRLIEAGRITLNGHIARHTDPIRLDELLNCLDRIELDGAPITQTETLALVRPPVHSPCRSPAHYCLLSRA